MLAYQDHSLASVLAGGRAVQTAPSVPMAMDLETTNAVTKFECGNLMFFSPAVSCLRNCLVCTENANECSRCEDEYEVSSAGECISSEIPNNILICES